MGSLVLVWLKNNQAKHIDTNKEGIGFRLDCEAIKKWKRHAIWFSYTEQHCKTKNKQNFQFSLSANLVLIEKLHLEDEDMSILTFYKIKLVQVI